MLSKINRNGVISVSYGVPAMSFEEEKTRHKENGAAESEVSQGSRNHHAYENYADLVAQPMKHDSDISGTVSDLVCTEQLRFSCCDDESEYSSSHGTTFSDLHSEIFPYSTQLELSDYTLSLFTDSGSQFSEGSVGEILLPMYCLFLQYRKDFCKLASPRNALNIEEDEVSLQLKEFVRFEDSDD